MNQDLDYKDAKPIFPLPRTFARVSTALFFTHWPVAFLNFSVDVSGFAPNQSHGPLGHINNLTPSSAVIIPGSKKLAKALNSTGRLLNNSSLH